jgi:hypothetical protein
LSATGVSRIFDLEDVDQKVHLAGRQAGLSKNTLQARCRNGGIWIILIAAETQRKPLTMPSGYCARLVENSVGIIQTHDRADGHAVFAELAPDPGDRPESRPSNVRLLVKVSGIRGESLTRSVCVFGSCKEVHEVVD